MNHIISQSLSPRGVAACERILSVVAFSNPAITYAPSLYALCALLLHYMDGKLLFWKFCRFRKEIPFVKQMYVILVIDKNHYVLLDFVLIYVILCFNRT